MGVDKREEDAGSGEGARTREEHRPLGDRVEDYLGFRSRLAIGIIFAALYIATFGPRTGWLPGVVSGVLGGAVIFLLLREVDERRKRRHRRR